MDNNYNNQYDGGSNGTNDFNNMNNMANMNNAAAWGNEQKVKDNGSFFKGMADCLAQFFMVMWEYNILGSRNKKR